MSIKKRLFIFWGTMDALAVALYCAQSVRHGRVPFVSDISSFGLTGNGLSGDGHSVLLLFFIFDLLLLVSLFASAWCFLTGKPVASKLALCQEVFRPISFRCSVTLFPLLLNLAGVSNVCLNSILFIFSEFLKIYSLWIYPYGKGRNT
ncbi:MULTISPECIES: hypothetical protein [Enterobacter]|uniref:hypothetical protein n=1 Tax=Enterobacter TaxID=547 RepID=UPI0005E44514|nr:MULTISPECIES: hypothetical protein [Enterobacter]EKM5742979.1 hypothetical protein [Enterobacter kobei]ELE9689751.1 hypothetical protein [Enterobacter kobei]ELE9731885.1 hypothetical protein [Enterobacter kobei]KJI57061.1 hypothetical protein UO85_02360 [Enterobacter kobei]KZQ11255.1 hypothetical protein A3N51_11670 [Enterobacter kobei]